MFTYPKFSRGEYSLGTHFWVYGVLFSGGLQLVWVFVKTVLRMYHFSYFISGILECLVYWYCFLAVRGIYKAANVYNGDKTLAVLAKIFGTIVCFWSVILVILAYFAIFACF